MSTHSESSIVTDPLPEGAVLVPLTQGAFALVDAEDALRVLEYRWFLHSCGYAARARRAADGPGPGAIFLHRAILDAPAGIEVRRRGGSRLDNRRANLRLATASQSRAGSALRGDNTSGFRGVTWCTRYGTWQAQIQVDGKRQFLGYFAAKDDAARAYDAAAQEAFGEYAQLNAPAAP